MHKIYGDLTNILIALLLVGCMPTNAHQNNRQAGISTSKNSVLDFKNGTYCFEELFKRDVTNVKLNISGNTVTGLMNRIPYEKDSARGKLTGSRDKGGEMDLHYEYIIEGIWQTETILAKIQDNKLFIKIGELQDINQDGHLTYKDDGQAFFSKALMRVDCK